MAVFLKDKLTDIESPKASFFMIIDLSPIEQLDAVLTFMAETMNNGTTLINIRSQFDIDKYKPANEIMGRLLKDGYINAEISQGLMNSSDIIYDITFDGRLFQSLGGYKNQQIQLEELRISNTRNEQQRITNENRLLWGTWFAGIAAMLVLLWYVFVWFYPNYSYLKSDVRKEMIKPTTDNILVIDTAAAKAVYPTEKKLKK